MLEGFNWWTKKESTLIAKAGWTWGSQAMSPTEKAIVSARFHMEDKKGNSVAFAPGNIWGAWKSSDKANVGYTNYMNAVLGVNAQPIVVEPKQASPAQLHIDTAAKSDPVATLSVQPAAPAHVEVPAVVAESGTTQAGAPAEGASTPAESAAARVLQQQAAAEAKRLADEAAAEQARKDAEAAAKAEQERLAQVEKARQEKEEEERKAKAAAEQAAKDAEAKRIADEAAAAEKAKKEAEAKRLADEAAAEQARKDAEEKKLAEATEAKRLADEAAANKAQLAKIATETTEYAKKVAELVTAINDEKGRGKERRIDVKVVRIKENITPWLAGVAREIEAISTPGEWAVVNDKMKQLQARSKYFEKRETASFESMKLALQKKATT